MKARLTENKGKSVIHFEAKLFAIAGASGLEIPVGKVSDDVGSGIQKMALTLQLGEGS